MFLGVGDYLFLIGLFLILQVFVPGFPKETLMILAGAVGGIFWGSLTNLFGLVLGAHIAYEVMNHGIEFIPEKVNQWVLTFNLESKIGERGYFISLLLMRLVPGAPNDVISFASGATKVPRNPFAWANFLSAIPYSILFALMGYYGKQSIAEVIPLPF